MRDSQPLMSSNSSPLSPSQRCIPRLTGALVELGNHIPVVAKSFSGSRSSVAAHVVHMDEVNGLVCACPAAVDRFQNILGADLLDAATCSITAARVSSSGELPKWASQLCV